MGERTPERDASGAPDSSIVASVVVPVYNDEDRIRHCIESLLSQTLDSDKYEVIIVDNNSTDGTADAIRAYPVKYLFEEKPGPAAARNSGIRVARGWVVAFTDSDCIASPDWLRLLVENIDGEKVGASAGNVLPLSRENAIERYAAGFWQIDKMVSGQNYGKPYAITANVAYKKAVLEEVGGFCEEYPVAASEDTDLGWRVSDRGWRFVYVPEAIVHHDHRATLGGLHGFGYKSGYGIEIHKRRYPDVLPKSNNVVAVWRKVARIVAMRRRGDRSERSRLDNDFYFWTGNLIGRLRSKLRLKP